MGDQFWKPGSDPVGTQDPRTGLILPPGAMPTARETKLAILRGNAKLRDGRLLKYQGFDIMKPKEKGSRLPSKTMHEWVCTVDGLRVLASIDQTELHGTLLHISVSYNSRLPDWDTVKMCKDVFFGDVDAAMLLPRQMDYVNAHKYTFHVWELPKDWGIR